MGLNIVSDELKEVKLLNGIIDKNDELGKIDGILSSGTKTNREKEKYSTIGVPIKDKPFLTLEEASKYFGIGINKLRSIADEDKGKYAFWVGSKRLIKRERLEKYLENAYSI